VSSWTPRLSPETREVRHPKFSSLTKTEVGPARTAPPLLSDAQRGLAGYRRARVASDDGICSSDRAGTRQERFTLAGHKANAEIGGLVGVS
jgi:hypothetical protein